jgi:hypothetical protein
MRSANETTALLVSVTWVAAMVLFVVVGFIITLGAIGYFLRGAPPPEIDVGLNLHQIHSDPWRVAVAVFGVCSWISAYMIRARKHYRFVLATALVGILLSVLGASAVGDWRGLVVTGLVGGLALLSRPAFRSKSAANPSSPRA